MKLQLILLDDLFYRGTGPTGPTGPTLNRSAYLVTFNANESEQGIPIPQDERLPINRKELDITGIVT